jgi:hypothetical protein
MIGILESRSPNNETLEIKSSSIGQKDLVSLASTLFAFLIIIAFGVFIFYMLNITNASEPEWSRTTYLFTGIEAIAFAATGFLFGKEVHRQEAKNAEIRATNSEESAIKAEKSASVIESNAKALTEAIKIKLNKQIQQGTYYENFDESTGLINQKNDIKELLELAERLFP